MFEAEDHDAPTHKKGDLKIKTAHVGLCRGCAAFTPRTPPAVPPLPPHKTVPRVISRV